MAPFRGHKRGQRSGRQDHRGRKPTYQASRVQDSDEEFEAQPDAEVVESEPELLDDLSDEDEETLPVKQNAYSALLVALGKSVEDDHPRRKKRKLGTVNGLTQSGMNRQSGSKEQRIVDIGEDGLVEDGDEPEEDLDDGSVGSEDEQDFFESHFASPGENELSQRLKDVANNAWNTRNILRENGGKWMQSSLSSAEHSTTHETFHPLNVFNFKPRLSQDALAGLTGSEKDFASQVFAYNDVLYADRTVPNSGSLRSTACLHALNHIIKTRDRVIKNNARLAKSGPDTALECRDQGFTRPKVLILLPTRQSCVRYVDSIVKICQPEQQENKKRFEDSFHQEEDLSSDRPDDYRELFSGNNDDMFRIGVKFTRKTIKYFSQFYNSDLIIASPLGLRQAISGKKPDADFLSSIEILIMDQTDALLMQNWEHVTHILAHLNLQPKEAHGCDFSRVRPWYLDGNAKYLRQTLILSSCLAPQILALLATQTHNVAGRLIFNPTYEGAILQPQSVGTKQVFLRFTSPALTADPTARFKHFISTILSSVIKMPRNPDGSGLGLLIYIPDSLDFPRIRNHFSFHPSCANISFGAIDENKEPANRDVRRARSYFEAGRHSVMLFTERAHHFHRYRLKGVKKVFFYGVPTKPVFYEEVSAFLGEQNEGRVRCLFSKWERLALERLVGSERVAKMVREKGGDVFEFL